MSAIQQWRDANNYTTLAQRLGGGGVINIASYETYNEEDIMQFSKLYHMYRSLLPRPRSPVIFSWSDDPPPPYIASYIEVCLFQ